jgi:hypothetical protein
VSRRKISTLLDEHLFRRVKLESARQGKQVSQILGAALERYLTETNGGNATTGVAAETWGVLKLDRRKVDRLMADEDDWLDA